MVLGDVVRPLEADAQQLVERPCGSVERGTIDQHRAILRGVSDRTRTGDRLDHNQELYQLSYAHRVAFNLA
jgi:hypothetical protein